MKRAGVLAALAVLAGGDSTSPCSWRAARRADPPPHASPLTRFEANVGQADPSVPFVARVGRSIALLRPDAIMVVPSRPPRGRSPMAPEKVARKAPAVVRLKGANASAVMVGEDAISAPITSFRGSSEGRAIPAYGRVRARAIYPGIDAVIRPAARGIEIDFEVAEGADPSAIALEGASVRADGSLAVGGLALSPPRSFERSPEGEIDVASAWSPSGGFALGARSGAPLVIDPVLDMATYLGGSGDDVVGLGGVTLDAAGNVYIAGTTTSADLPVTAGAPDTSLRGEDDVFVAKLTPDGKSLLYCTYLGGSAGETYTYLHRPISVDAAGAAYVGGQTASADFPTTAGAYDRTPNGGFDAYVTKIAPDGKSLVYSTLLGSSGDDHGFGLGVDPSGAVYVGGWTKGSDFPLTASHIATTSTAFVTKLAPGGGSLVYSTLVGGPTSVIFDIAVKNGVVYAVGDTRPGPYPVTPGAMQPVYGGGSFDAFLLALKPDGTDYVYATYIGGDALDEAWQVDVDAAGNTLVVGNTYSSTFPVTANATMPAFGGEVDGWMATIDPKGQKMLFGSYFSGPGFDGTTGGCFDPAGNAFVTGMTSGGLVTKSSCAPDGLGFMQMVEPSGNVRFTTLLPEQAFGVACASSRVVGILGAGSELGIATSGAFGPSWNGGADEVVFGLRPGPSGAGCMPCDGPFGASSGRACPSSERPLCNTNGALVGSCTVCTPDDLSRCDKDRVCSVVTGECAVCNGDRGTTASAPCLTAAAPTCDGTRCRKCTSDADCADTAAIHAGPTCALATGACVAPSGSDGGSAPDDASAPPSGPDASNDGSAALATPEDPGCACRATPSRPSATSALALGAIVIAARRRRSRARDVRSG